MTTSRMWTLVLCGALSLAACGGAQKPAVSPGAPGKAGGDAQARNDFGDPADAVHGNDNRPRSPSPDPAGPAGSSPRPGAGGAPGAPGEPGDTADPTADRNRAGGAEAAATPQVTMPNYDPDPAQARAQVDQHLQVARQALAGATPDPDTALREARLALDIDAASVDAAAMIAFAYYHKRLYGASLRNLYESSSTSSAVSYSFLW